MHASPQQEALYLDYIEGRLSPEQEASVRASLDAVDLRRLDHMRTDQMLVSDLPDLLAPPELLDEVASCLERDMLLDIEDGSAGSIRIATSPKRDVRRDLIGAFTSDSLGRRLAVAASVLLVLGAGATWGVMKLGGPPSIDLGPIAMDESTPEPEGNPPQPSGLHVEEDPVTLATSETVDPTPAVEVATTSPLPERVPLTLAEARTLLEDHRLMIRVRSADGVSTLASLREMSEDHPVFRVDEGSESTVLAQLDRTVLPVLERGVTLPVVIASEHPDDAHGRARIDVESRERLSEFVAVYGASLDAERPALGALLSVLTMPGQEAVFEAMDEPADLLGDLSPRSILWWSSSSHWRQRVHVPIVIEAVK